MKRTELLNLLIDKGGYTSYLEIGVRNPVDNLNGIEIVSKVGVDPKMRIEGDVEVEEDKSTAFVKCTTLIKSTSNEFFKANEATYDIIFIDGDHSQAQVLKDVRAAFKCLNKDGVVVLHDCLPTKPSEALPEKPKGGGAWCGEAYRVFMKFRGYKGYVATLVDTDHGCGIITKGEGQDFDVPKDMKDYTADQFIAIAADEETAKEWLDLITANQFMNRL